MEDESALRRSETEGFPEQSVRKHSLKRTRAEPGEKVGGDVIYLGLLLCSTIFIYYVTEDIKCQTLLGTNSRRLFGHQHSKEL